MKKKKKARQRGSKKRTEQRYEGRPCEQQGRTMRLGGAERGMRGARRDLNSCVKLPLWPIHEWNETSGRGEGTETVASSAPCEWTRTLLVVVDAVRPDFKITFCESFLLFFSLALSFSCSPPDPTFLAQFRQLFFFLHHILFRPCNIISTFQIMYITLLLCETIF